MYFSFTDGREVFKAELCAHCQLNTAGEHEENCPYISRERTAKRRFELKIEDLNDAISEAERFLKRAKVAKAKYATDKEAAAAKRASMDLSRALSKIRRAC